MQTSNHILAKEGVLTSFSIAKRVPSEEIKKLRSKISVDFVDDEQIDRELTKVILEKTKKSLDFDKIPGLLMKSVLKEEAQTKRFAELTFFASLIAKKMKDKKIDKNSSCYIINAIVNMLDLTEKDFDEFHENFSDPGEDDDSLD
jgi:hypothetical protein